LKYHKYNNKKAKFQEVKTMKINAGMTNQIKNTYGFQPKKEVALGGGDGFEKSVMDSPLESDQLKEMKAGGNGSQALLGIAVMFGGIWAAAAMKQPLLMPVALVMGAYVASK